MITNTGKNILAKYLIGQAPAYASHIAVGCGSTPLLSDDVLDDYSNKTSLDFEMFRTPIVSRGYVNEGGFPKVVFTAELPTTERYEITELGIYSAGSNPSAGVADSKPVLVFSQNENWEYHDTASAVQIPYVTTYLGGENILDIAQESLVFSTNADNKTLQTETRILRYESCRFLNHIIMMAGNSSNLTTETISGATRLKVESGSKHIHLTGTSVDLSKNSPADELKLAFSIVNRDGTTVPSAVPNKVRLLLEFSSTDEHNAGSWARFEVDIANGSGYDFSTNRYVVISKPLQELYKSTGFTWSDVKVVKIYATVLNGLDIPTNDFYIALDALRLENKTAMNPLYGLTGYTVVRNVQAKPIVKLANTTSLVEFRFALDVGTNATWTS